MLGTSVVFTLRTFSSEELERFEQFLSSPYYNKKKTLLTFYKHLRKFAPGFDSPKLERHLIWKSLYKGKDFNYGVMKNLIYELGKLVEKYLQVSSFERSGFPVQLRLAWEYIDRDLVQLIDKQIRVMEKSLLDGEWDLESFRNSMDLTAVREYLAGQKFSGNHTNVLVAQKYLDDLTLFYLLSSAERYSSILMSGSYNNLEIDKEDVYDLLRLMERKKQINSKLLELLKESLFVMLEPGDESHYRNCKKLLLEYRSELSLGYLHKFITGLLNYSNTMLLSGKTSYNKEVFDNISLLVDTGAILAEKDGFVNQYTYVIAVSSACNEGEYEWAERFITEYRKHLRPEFREQYYEYALVTLNMKKKEPEKALEHLSKIRILNLMDKMTVKRYEAMIFYESGYEDQFRSVLDSIANLKGNRELSDSAKELLTKFIHFAKRLGGMKFSGKGMEEPDFALDSLKREIIAATVINKNWLLEKAGELSG
ncbi:MAG: hypothetical protein K1X85_00135 [Ignavibacteria bacterium]|nr:hypothetical protein [Ignavibacteria bacterium]